MEDNDEGKECIIDDMRIDPGIAQIIASDLNFQKFLQVNLEKVSGGLLQLATRQQDGSSLKSANFDPYIQSVEKLEIGSLKVSSYDLRYN